MDVSLYMAAVAAFAFFTLVLYAVTLFPIVLSLSVENLHGDFSVSTFLLLENGGFTANFSIIIFRVIYFYTLPHPGIYFFDPCSTGGHPGGVFPPSGCPAPSIKSLFS
jgi:hypothetical protein